MQKTMLKLIISVGLSVLSFVACAEQLAAEQVPVQVNQLPSQPPTGSKLPVAVRIDTAGGGSAQSVVNGVQQVAAKPKKPVLQFNPPKKDVWVE